MRDCFAGEEGETNGVRHRLKWRFGMRFIGNATITGEEMYINNTVKLYNIIQI